MLRTRIALLVVCVMALAVLPGAVAAAPTFSWKIGTDADEYDVGGTVYWTLSIKSDNPAAGNHGVAGAVFELDDNTSDVLEAPATLEGWVPAITQTGSIVGDKLTNLGFVQPGFGTQAYDLANDGQWKILATGTYHVYDDVTNDGWHTLTAQATTANYWGTLGANDPSTGFSQVDGSAGSATFYVPEPASIALLGIGGLLVVRRRKR